MSDWNRVRGQAVLAQMARDARPEFTFDRLFRSTEYHAPRLERVEASEEGQMLFTCPPTETWYSRQHYEEHYFPGPKDLLERFVQLPDADDDRVVDFAQRFGLMKLCADQCRPGPHYRPPFATLCKGFPGWEYVDDWKHVAGQFRAAILTAALLHKGELPSGEDWLPLIGESRVDPSRGLEHIDEDGDEVWVGRSLDTDWAVLGEELLGFWQVAAVQPTFRFLPKMRMEIEFQGEGLFGFLTRELVFTVAKVEGFTSCSGCRKVFLPKRRPAQGQNSWCGGPDCEKVRLRLAKQKQRAGEKA